MAFKQEINIPLILTIGLVSGITLLVVIFGVQGWYESAAADEATFKASEAPLTEFQQQKLDQQKSLTTLAWTDKSKVAVTMPIDRAMEVMVETDGNLPTTQPAAATQPAAVAQ